MISASRGASSCRGTYRRSSSRLGSRRGSCPTRMLWLSSSNEGSTLFLTSKKKLQIIAENTTGSIGRACSSLGTAMTQRTREATAILKIDGMSRKGSAERLRIAAGKLDGVFLVDINYILDNVTVSYNPDKLTLAQVRSKLDTGKHAPKSS